ncbi:penicillin acylase family protein [Streptomyces chumphonensis]|uniref:Penicillin acylase family protein n=1 Tax=Streptomyces chumphonensis TaxID=1214925 RepID=A0A927IBU6_9ACTN|nr:penicillin acylase family protein [Streptomyces chumphonensis]MBD3933313.1 penicillin acylase family protein [Streptomyces chumphonensis]
MPVKKRSRRARLVVITLVLLLVGGLVAGGFWTVGTVRASFPQTTGSVQLEGLSGTVEVKRDGNGIPQIYASSAEDLFMAQGFVHAQDRFWEMDVRRHTTAGRLSEMFGEEQVRTDAFLRTLGWHDVAKEEYETELSEETKDHLTAYSAGVNAYLEEHGGADLSLEYAALGLVNDAYEPQPWTPVDSVAWLKAMAWDLRGNVEDEIDRSLLSTRLDEEQIEDLYPDYPTERHRPIVEGGAVDEATETFLPDTEPAPDADTEPAPGDAADGTGQDDALPGGVSTQLGGLAASLDDLPALLGRSGSGIGSNSWVVSGDYTTTGRPLLANDPHLAPQLPSVWTQMGLHCKQVSERCPYEVSGFTFAGLPGVVIGHNQDIAWGLTNLGADVTDLYLEKIEDGRYLYDGEMVPYETRTEVIKVAGGKDREITVRSTRHGPIVSDRNTELSRVGEGAPVTGPAPDRGDGYAVSLRWTALSPSATMDAVFKINKASDFEEFRAAAADFAVPSQNLVYADTEGNIGYQAPGRIPVRGKGDGRYPAPGWDPDYEWTGYVEQSALPYEYNPERGYIVTANQAVVDQETYPYLLTEDWSYGARSQRINDLIQSKIEDGGKVSMDDMQAMQSDSSSEIAKLLVPYLLKIDVEDPYVREAQQLLEGWDYTQDADSAPAAYFNGVWRNLLMLAFGNKLPKELRVEGECLRVRPADDSGPLEDLDGTARTVRECGTRAPDAAQPDGGDRWFEIVRRLVEDPDNAWWSAPADGLDTPAAEGRDELLARAMKDARWELTTKLGKNIDTWSWGRLHRLMLENQTLGTAGPALVQRMLNRGPWEVPGGKDAVNATGWNAAGGYDVVWVPSMRMVVNLEDFDKSRWINLTGASGHAYHPHYTDQTDLWAKGELLPWAYSRKAVDASAEDTMALTP